MIGGLLGLTVICLVGLSEAQRPFSGACPQVTVQQQFNITKYMGHWYEQQRFFAIFEAFSSCVQAEYTLRPADGHVIVDNKGRVPLIGYRSVRGDAVANPDDPAKLAVRFNENQPRGDYWVLTTDYNTYSVVWSCTQFEFGFFTWNTQFAWILTRSPEGVSAAVTKQLTDLMESYDIDTSKFSRTSQNNCP